MARKIGGFHPAKHPLAASRGSVVGPQMLHRITQLLDERFGLDTLWVFGSQASKKATSRSDVDLAALFRSRPSTAELLDAREELADLLGRAVDLVDLDQASPIVMMQVLRYGKLLLDRSPAHRHRLLAAAPSLYEDLMIVRRECERALFERVRGG